MILCVHTLLVQYKSFFYFKLCHSSMSCHFDICISLYLCGLDFTCLKTLHYLLFCVSNLLLCEMC